MSVAARLSEKVGEKKNIINNIYRGKFRGRSGANVGGYGKRTANAERGERKENGDERDARRSEWGEKGD